MADQSAPPLEFWLAHLAAATLTQACIGNAPSSIQIPPDGKLLDKPTMAKNLYEWEIHKVFFNALVQTPTDQSAWPWPAHSGNSGGNLVGSLQQLAAQAPGLAGAVAQIVAQLQGLAQPSLPNPGVAQIVAQLQGLAQPALPNPGVAGS